MPPCSENTMKEGRVGDGFEKYYDTHPTTMDARHRAFSESSTFKD